MVPRPKKWAIELGAANNAGQEILDIPRLSFPKLEPPVNRDQGPHAAPRIVSPTASHEGRIEDCKPVSGPVKEGAAPGASSRRQ